MSSYSILDEVDLRILQSLQEDSSRSHKEIGRLVHLTGQAVGARIRKLQDEGVLENFTVRCNPAKMGLHLHAFITVFMRSPNTHSLFQAFVEKDSRIVEMHRVTSEGCYWMRAMVGTQMELNALLDELLAYGNYKLSLSIGQLKG